MENKNFPPKPKSKFPIIPKEIIKKDCNDSNEEDEFDDMIAELSKTPKLYEIPRPQAKVGKKIKNYEPIDWKTAFPNNYFLNEKTPIYWSGNSGPNLVCLHGAGHSGLSFAPLALKNKSFRIVSFDFRGHGFNIVGHGEDLSQETLIKDTVEVLNYINEKFPEDNIILLGHSMGGSIATKTCAYVLKNKEQFHQLYDKLQGLIMVDVVEGSAMDALPFMESIVNNRPPQFSTVEKGVEYMFKSGTIKNNESARISVPPLLRAIEKNGTKLYEWKTDLMASQKYWPEWFAGLNKAFLAVKVPKILMLAGIERMDKDLTIAQMQGKFQLSVVRNVGHLIHEDDPSKTMEIIEEFIHTFRITPKLSEMKPIIGKLGSTKLPEIIKYSEN